MHEIENKAETAEWERLKSRAAFEGIQSATILKPGDRVLIECGSGARQLDLQPMHRQLKECFPDVVFFIMVGAKVVLASESGVEDVVVKPAEETTE